MLYYCPLELYKERYTVQWSAPVTGWVESRLIEKGIEYRRIDPNNGEIKVIKTGCAVDAVERSIYCFKQVEVLLLLAESGELTSSDIIYFDDFWHPGMEALAYTFHLLGIKPKMFAFLHAQSVDEFDFTYPMRDWIRFYEKGNAKILDGIFVSCTLLKSLLLENEISTNEKIHITGHPIVSHEIKNRMVFAKERKNHVIFSSRWDDEKNPLFFMDVCRTILEVTKDIVFIVCTGSSVLRSNNIKNLQEAFKLQETYPENFIIKVNLTKEQYYAELTQAKIQINTASQDFVSITALEASVAGCFLLYPNYRSFPETFNYSKEFLYNHLDCKDLVHRIYQVIYSDTDLWSKNAIMKRSWIHNRFDTSINRMLSCMQTGSCETPYFL